MSTTLLVGFLVTVLIAHAVPGPDFALILRHAARGRRHGRAASLGVVTGHAIHLTAAALGLSALLASSAMAFTVVKVIGGLYLVYLGVQALLAARRRTPESRTDDAVPEPSPVADARVGRAYVQGFITNVLNPKAVVFYMSLLPQFLDRGLPMLPQLVVLGVITMTSGLAWWMLFVGAVDRVRGLLARDPVRRTLDGLTGVLFIGLAVRLVRTPA